jgi:hypothetical protein
MVLLATLSTGTATGAAGFSATPAGLTGGMLGAGFSTGSNARKTGGAACGMIGAASGGAA